MIDTSTIQAKGETMVPKPVRDRLGLHPGDTVQWQDASGGVLFQKLVAQTAPRPRIARIRHDSATDLDYFDSNVSAEEAETAALSANPDRQ